MPRRGVDDAGAPARAALRGRRAGQDRRRAPGSEGQFLACSFWLVSALALNGRAGEARALFERLLDLRNEVGLLAEEYDVDRRRQVGNFPQAFSHLALIEAAQAITTAGAHTSETPAAGPRATGSWSPAPATDSNE